MMAICAIKINNNKEGLGEKLLKDVEKRVPEEDLGSVKVVGLGWWTTSTAKKWTLPILHRQKD
jgi:hypothetical protein